MSKVNVLGTEYEVIIDTSSVPNGCDGVCKSYSKEIHIRSVDDMLCSDDSAEVKEKRYNEVMRHELFHAFFDESGLGEYSNNEQLVTWLAVQFPKLLKAFIDVGCADLPKPEFVIKMPTIEIPDGFEKELHELANAAKGGVVKC